MYSNDKTQTNNVQEIIDIANDENEAFFTIKDGSLRSFSKSISVRDLKSYVERGKINIYPFYQRNKDSWSNHIKCFFINSLLHSLPIPNILIWQNIDKNGNFISYDLIDGLQRLTTIFDFIDNKFSLSDKQLKDDETYYEKFFSDLEEKKQNDLLDFSFDATVILPIKNDFNNDLIKSEIFKRLNSSSTILNNQEIRRAVYFDKKEIFKTLSGFLKDEDRGSKFRILLNKASKYGKEKTNLRFADEELLLHLLSYCWLLEQSDDKIKPSSVNNAIHYFMKSIKLDKLNKMLKIFLKIFELCNSYYEDIFYAIYFDNEGNIIKDKYSKIYCPFTESITVFLYQEILKNKNF